MVDNGMPIFNPMIPPSKVYVDKDKPFRSSGQLTSFAAMMSLPASIKGLRPHISDQGPLYPSLPFVFSFEWVNGDLLGIVIQEDITHHDSPLFPFVKPKTKPHSPVKRKGKAKRMGSSSTEGAVAAILHRFTNGVPSNSLIVSRNGLSKSSRKLLLSASSISLSTSILYQVNTNSNEHQFRTISTFPPLCMGRRSSKIAGRKGAQDAKKAKIYSRIGKEVVSAYVGSSYSLLHLLD
ncbi:hypothetical protein CRYUN_Cryun33cG0090200 [Craigia yunnanensis]